MRLLLISVLVGCGITPEDEGPTDLASDSVACAALNAGDEWAFRGECSQMRTPVALAYEGCAITLDYSATGMSMGMPYEGVVVDQAVTFGDGDSVTGCAGVIEDADTISGQCDGGCTFTLVR